MCGPLIASLLARQVKKGFLGFGWRDIETLFAYLPSSPDD